MASKKGDAEQAPSASADASAAGALTTGAPGADQRVGVRAVPVTGIPKLRLGERRRRPSQENLGGAAAAK